VTTSQAVDTELFWFIFSRAGRREAERNWEKKIKALKLPGKHNLKC